jgi:general nucleoside transport system permease protein
MTATAGALSPARRGGLTRERILGVVYLGLATVIAFVFAGVEPGDTSAFGLNLGRGGVQLPDVVVPSAPTAYLLAIIAAGLGAVQLVRGFGTRWAIVLGIVVVAFVLAFLTWASAGGSINFAGLLQSTLQRSVPITFGALSGILCERAGVVNVAIEGMLLTGAFVSAVVASASGNNWLGLVSAVAAGGLLAALLAVLAIRYLVDQIIAGVVLNILAIGLTSFMATRVLTPNPNLNNPERFGELQIPLLGDVPLLGPIVLENNIFVYLMFAAIAILSIMLFRTRWGLRVRAVGEHPKAADTVGINVHAIRYRNVILGGMMAGVGGAYFTLGSTGSFEQEMTAGRGFIGLAAMIFGGWAPVGSFLAALVFGFADALQSRLSILNIPVASQFLQMAPYIVTIVVVAGLVGRVRAPAADGRPYTKE